MAIIVDEIVISVEVGSAPAGGQAEAAGGGDRDALIEECVQRVLEILERREER